MICPTSAIAYKHQLWGIQGNSKGYAWSHHFMKIIHVCVNRCCNVGCHKNELWEGCAAISHIWHHVQSFLYALCSAWMFSPCLTLSGCFVSSPLQGWSVFFSKDWALKRAMSSEVQNYPSMCPDISHGGMLYLLSSSSRLIHSSACEILTEMINSPCTHAMFTILS